VLSNSARSAEFPVYSAILSMNFAGVQLLEIPIRLLLLINELDEEITFAP
jgi:hypothetical protein